MSYRNYSTAASHIVDPSGLGDFKTIQSAITAAVSGQTIFVRPGTYTENLTLKVGVNLTAYTCDSSLNNTGHVIISGKATLTAAGTVTISGIQLQTNSDFFLAVTGSANSVVNLVSCYLNASNNTGISYTSSGASSAIACVNCIGNIGTTGITMHSVSGAGSLTYQNCSIGNSGASTTASTNSSGTVSMLWSNLGFPLTSSSTGGLQGYFCTINNGSTNTTSIIHGGSGASNEFSYCWISSGTAQAVTVNTNSLNLHACEVLSSNANAIGGTGTLIYSSIFMGSSSTAMNPTSTTQRVAFSGGISFDKGTNNLNVYTVGTFTPTIQGGSTGGSTTYGVQNGYYTKIGNLVTCQLVVTATTATGTGDVNVGALPFTIKNQSSGNTQAALSLQNTALTWPVSKTYGVFLGAANTTFLIAPFSQTAVGSSNLQMAANTMNFQTTVSYQV